MAGSVRHAVDLNRPSSVTELLREHARSRPHEQALVFVRHGEDDAALTYAELDAHARRIAAWLQRRFAPGERVLLTYPSGLPFVTAFVACLYAGMIAVPTPLPGQYRHERRRVRVVAADAGTAVIFTDAASLAMVTAWASAEGIDGVQVIATDDADFDEPGAWSMPPTGPDTLALLQYTSGSTADPKGVMVSHRNVLHNAALLCQMTNIDSRTRFGGWIPLFHDMGLLVQVMPALLLGSACVLMSPSSFLRRPHLWLEMIDRHNVGWSSAPNFAYELCGRRVTDDQIAQLDLSRWRYAANGSERIQPAIMADFAKRFAAAGFRAEAFAPGYGLAESTCVVTVTGRREPVVGLFDPDAMARDEIRPSGFPGPGRELASVGLEPGSGPSAGVPDLELRIVAPESREVLPDGQIGEIWLRGPSVAQGYWRNGPATESVFRARTACGAGDYLRTGDLGAVEDGELYVTGRIKEVMIIHGRNHYPQDVEFELRGAHGELAEVFGAVFTVPVDDDEDALVITHEVRGRLSADELSGLAARMRQTVAREFGISAAGVALLRRGGVRRTTSGKIQRPAMRELFLAGDLDAVHFDLDQRLRAVVAQSREGTPPAEPVAGESRADPVAAESRAGAPPADPVAALGPAR